MATTASSGNPSRDAKLNRYFFAVVQGEQSLKTPKDGNRFIEAICGQPDPPLCIDKIVSGPSGLAALQVALRFSDSADFQNGPATSLIKYIQSPALASIHGGKYLHQIIHSIVEPPFFWNPFLASFRTHILGLEAQQCFGWLLSELVTLPDSRGGSYLSIAQDVSIQTQFESSASFEVRVIGQRIKHVASVFGSSHGEGNALGPGGRHDNDFLDFREIAIHPTADELQSKERPFLREAQDIDDPSTSSDRLAIHLDNQFRLLRQDMLTEMYEELQICFGKKQGRHRGLVVDGLILHDIECGDHPGRKPLLWGLRFKCSTDLRQLAQVKPQARREYLSNNRNIFKHQSLACLIIDNDIISFPTIYRDIDHLAQIPPVVTLQLAGKSSTLKSLLRIKTARHIRLVQIDTAVFAYEPILKGLQELRDPPLTEEMLFWESGKIMKPPSHAPSKLIATLEARPNQDLRDMLGLSKSVKLDRSQFTSLLTGLRQRVSLIQGPPGKARPNLRNRYIDVILGTGKSFIGALIAKSIFQYTKTVILVVCFKNHALDQFLEDLLDIGIPSDEMVRLGGQSSPRTKSLQLYDQPFIRAKVPYSTLNELRAKAETMALELQASFQRYQSANPRHPDVMEHLEFSPQGSDYYEAFSVPRAEDGSIRVGRRGKAVDEYYLLDRWLHGADAGIFSDQVSKESRGVWSMPRDARQSLLSKWRQEILSEQVLDLQALAEPYNKLLAELERLRRTKDAQVIASRRIIACTTT